MKHDDEGVFNATVIAAGSSDSISSFSFWMAISSINGSCCAFCSADGEGVSSSMPNKDVGERRPPSFLPVAWS